MTIPDFNEIIEQNDQTAARREHLDKLRELVGNVYPNKFERSRISGGEDTITTLLNFPPVQKVVAEIEEVVAKLAERERPPADIKDALNARLKELGTARISGRLAVPPRVMGKAAFVHLSDGISRLQIYVKRDDIQGVSNDSVIGSSALQTETDPQSAVRDPRAVDGWELFQLLDHGDFIGVEGYLFITNTGELSVHVEKLQFLSKAMLPMPDKMHGIADPEIRQRQRYADLIASSLQIEHEGMTTREVFETRARVISSVRRFLEDHGYIEVETPMLTPKATGAAAKPFETHHNALDITLYARIAPELYLKRLVVGGFEKVYELNRNFRNEGISFKHNPEFTMLEFYCAYMDVNGMMDFCEELLRQSVQNAIGGLTVEYEGKELDFSRFERVTMREAVERAGGNPSGSEGVTGGMSDAALLEAFEENVEPNLAQPTFIIDFPKSISPLSKASPENPHIAERFELFINGMEVANGFSELNDPKEQYERFIDQMAERERGDDEAMVLDEDYIRALSYGMPPAAGIGIGIDRLVMLLTNKHSIRDVILFPHLRPERRSSDPGDVAVEEK
jgi:lysyl-tRNA synthetase class 2